MELVKSTIEHREQVVVGFSILQYARLKCWSCFNNFFDQFCDDHKFEEIEVDTDSLYLALPEEDLDDCILPRKGAEWTEKRSKDCMPRTGWPDSKDIILQYAKLKG